ncbi:hypothetical protein F4Y93_14790 [Candidatus Poribacteria bacterium]|nr:hypothetical protein [Candidatus Poribacteria bacterium]
MTDQPTSFPASIDFNSMLRIISEQVYETPLAFIRENVQNAVDAIRIQAFRENRALNDAAYQVSVSVDDKVLSVRDNGIGMSSTDLQRFFWTIGASGKRNAEAIAAGCVGEFGIGGFANFGVCETLEVISQASGSDTGTLTRLSETDIKEARTSYPKITLEKSALAAPRGTMLVGHLRESANLDQLRNYLRDFVQYVPVAVSFNGELLSQRRHTDPEERRNYSIIGDSLREWQDGGLALSGRLFEDRGHTLIAEVDGMSIDGKTVATNGLLRFENGPLDVSKHGFKLCATQLGSSIGVSGRIDCDLFVPTAGRDSLDGNTSNLLQRIVAILERVAIEEILKSPDRISQNARVFRYVIRNGMIGELGAVPIRFADGSEGTLGDIRRRVEHGNVGVFFGTTQKQSLNQIMQARGHIVVILSSETHRPDAERQYLERYCAARPFDGMIDFTEHYSDLGLFEKIFLSNLELTISQSYEVEHFRLIPGKLTEDIPVFLKEQNDKRSVEILVDVRHPEITKLEQLGFTSLFYSLISTFCHEYLGQSLKKWSPRFFGNGALNLELFAKRRSELWTLVTDDIRVVLKGGQRHVVTRSDIQIVNIAGGQEESPPMETPHPRLLCIVDQDEAMGLADYYIRVPDTAYRAYGDLLQSCESRGLVWAGNKVTYVASDTVSAAFQYEIRLDELVISDFVGEPRAEGTVEIRQPLQEIFDGIYFPIPGPLEPFLIPKGDQEIRLELYCDWIDMRTAKHWRPAEV